MALATVIIRETNTVSVTVTTCTNSNMSSTDAANVALSTSTAIAADSYSYEKWQRFQVSANASGNTIQSLRVWRTGTLGGASDTHLTNARTSGYAGAASYTTPVNTVSSYTQTMPATDPGAANVGIGGTLTPTSDGVGLITTTGYSDYIVHQVHVHSSTTAGPASANTMYYQYDEYA
jgi:hypothetical protein